MLVEVPLPVWKMSTTNWSSCFPSTTSSAARSTPGSPLIFAAALLISPRARRNARGSPRPLIGKFSTARAVCAPYKARSGTRISPIVSRSIR